jgi:hypothetical protein
MRATAKVAAVVGTFSLIIVQHHWVHDLIPSGMTSVVRQLLFMQQNACSLGCEGIVSKRHRER